MEQRDLTQRRGEGDAKMEEEIGHSQGMSAATRIWERQGTHSALQHLEGVLSCQHLDFSPVNQILDIWLPEL